MSPPKFEIFVIFCYFLRYPKFQVVWQLARQLVYQVCYNRYHVSLYLWLVGSVLKHCKVPKYYDQDRRFRMFISNVYYKRKRLQSLNCLFSLVFQSSFVSHVESRNSFCCNVFSFNWSLKTYFFFRKFHVSLIHINYVLNIYLTFIF